MLPIIMHPAVFIGGSVLIGILFAIQEWVGIHRMGMHAGIALLLLAWTFHFFLWGSIAWTLWALFRPQIQRAGILSLLLGFLPLSIAISVGEEMAFIYVFSHLPINHPNLGYWQRLTMYLASEFIDNMVIFWCAFFLFRGVDYYQRYRENEETATHLEIELANARLSALRMQLNPHFLFNTMNSISSLMRIDVEAADRMLEQLSCLMRITLERGDAQLITVRDEMEFIETYLEMQGQRYAGRVEQSIAVDPGLYDALVPTMLLQPIVENAFMHGLSKISTNGKLSLSIKPDKTHIQIQVSNSGLGLIPKVNGKSNGHGLGLSNIRNRLRLHYSEDSSLQIEQIENAMVRVTISLPLQFSAGDAEASGYERVL